MADVLMNPRTLLAGCLLAALSTACAGPVEILRNSRHTERRLKALETLKEEDYEGRFEAMEAVLGDDDRAVAADPGSPPRPAPAPRPRPRPSWSSASSGGSGSSRR